QAARTESPRAELADVLIDALRPAQELLATAEQLPVVIQVVHVDFVATTSDLVQKRPRGGVSLFRDDLERRLNFIAVIHVHQPGTPVAPERGLDVVRNNRTARCTVWPEPYERQLGDPPASEA